MAEPVKITLRPDKEQSLLRFHPWVFSGAIKKMSGNPTEGELVKVYSSENKFLGIGHYQPSSIAVRILSFQDVEINQDFWNRKLVHALEVRKAIGLADSEETNAYRLVHGEE